MSDQHSLFVTRLSRWLMAVIGILTVLTISNQFAEPPSLPAYVPDVRSSEGAQILERLHWVGTGFGFGLLAFLAYSAWSFSQRRSWARRVLIGLLVFGVVAGAWWGVLFVLSALGAMNLPGPANASNGFRVSLHLASGAIGFVALAFAYLCWRLIARLRSPEIRSEFRSNET
jgi:MFS family permease